MTAMTPLKCFRVRDLWLYTEDYTGLRTPVCLCTDTQNLEWLTSSLTAFHHKPVKQWDEE